ncbi:MAG: hypothetical protein QNJ12_07615 [Ilumatobacter sp.]|uniref:hypothetical protein n=1 Tax=Ilumatobacter sp. TaxID=1967498 RepID=UPI002608EAB0|nr:hypothetical protein [Ilumatobacter sp.]MDJ0768646.1 hypothetical protein [Ilumatobacter sp.]
MSTEIDEFRKSLVAAVQAELERHASAVVAEVDRLREEGRRDRAEIRAEFNQQLAAVVQALEQVQNRSEGHADTVRKALEQRLDDAEARQTRRLDDVTSGLEGLVNEAARPMLAQVRDDQEAMNRRVDGLDTNLRKFDEQAARMVTYFNDVSQRMEQRQDELGEALQTDIGSQVDALKKLVEENDSTVRRFQNEVGQSVTQKMNDAEDRFNNRLLATESRMQEDNGQKIAEIDVHVSRVSSGLDEALGVVNDRIAAIDDRFVETDRRIEAAEEAAQGIDAEAIDELKEKMSSAAGEAMLVRIEMERLEKGVNEKTDGLAVRLTEVETNMSDVTLDVSTAVQLDRMEEIERALLEIDPTKFVLKDDAGTGTGDGASAGDDEQLKNADEGADDISGVAAISEAAEGS